MNLTFNFVIIWENGTPNKRTFGTRLLILVQKMKEIRDMCLYEEWLRKYFKI